jgi:hypothetical protein
MLLSKKVILLLLLLIFHLPNVLGAVFEYDVVSTCPTDNICIEKDPITFVIIYSFNYDEYLELYDEYEIKDLNIVVKTVEIKDKQFDTLIARNSTNKVFNIFTYDEPLMFGLWGVLPPPTQGNSLYYVPCFEKEVSYRYRYFYDSLGYYSDWQDYKTTQKQCGSDSLRLEVFSLSDIECRNAGNCEFDETCVDHKCKKLICEDYQAYQDHTCYDLECASDEIAKNHACEKVICSDDETARNHVCEVLKCGFLEMAKNHKCNKNYTLIAILIVLGAAIVSLIITALYFKKRRIKKGKK